MPLFRKKQSWERTFRLRSRRGAAQGFLIVLFWTWGGLGLLFSAGSLFGLTENVGIGTSASVTATCLVWIGGMFLFGMGAMLSHSDFDGERPVSDDYGDVRVTG